MNSKLLSAFGYSKDYYLTENGHLFNAALGKEIIRDNLNRISIKDSNNKTVRIAFKTLYRQVFNKEYCKDSIKDLKGEVWKEVDGTKGRYYVSNCGRVKSLCGYTAKLLQPYGNMRGYLIVKINGQHQKIHRLVASAFIEYQQPKDKAVVHHKDRNRENNNVNNLEWLTVEQHNKIPKVKRIKD